RRQLGTPLGELLADGGHPFFYLAFHHYVVVDDGGDPVQFNHLGLQGSTDQQTAHRPISLRCSLKCIVFTLSVARDAFVEKTVDTIAGNAAESLEDHLQEDAAVALVTGNRLELVIVDPVTVDETELPAAAVIFKTAEGFQGSVTGEIMLRSEEHAPLRVERPDEGHVRLIDAAILVFVERAGQGIEGV